MSGQALIWAANVRGLAPATKIVLIQLAERHNKDTGRCDPRIQKLAEDCEMSRASLMRHLATLEETGLITRVSQGLENGGRASNQYDLHMSETDRGGQRSQIETGGKGLKSEGQRSQIEQAKVSQVRPPYIDEPVLNLKEPRALTRSDDLFSAEGLAEEATKTESQETRTEEQFDRFWKAYPASVRKTDKPKARTLFAQIVAGRRSGIPKTDPEEIIDGARRYAGTSPDPQYVPLPATWLNGARWEVEQVAPAVEPPRHYGGHRRSEAWGEVVR